MWTDFGSVVEILMKNRVTIAKEESIKLWQSSTPAEPYTQRKELRSIIDTFTKIQ